MSEEGQGNGESGHGGARDEQSVAQWIAAGLSLLLVLGTLGFLLYEELAIPKTPPQLAARVDSIAPAPGGWQVEVAISNQGSETAAEVQVSGEAGGETSSATIDYVPAGATRRAVLIFTADPRAADLRVRVAGFDYP